VAFVGGVNSDIENGRIKPDAPPAQLYDLEADVNQTTNLYSQYPEVVQEMRTLLARYAPPKRKPASRKGDASASDRAAKRTAATPSARSASFGFEAGELEPWKVIAGGFKHIVGNRDDFFHNKGEYNKQGDHYLTTLETSPEAERGSAARCPSGSAAEAAPVPTSPCARRTARRCKRRVESIPR
jgi:hypothetical protein